MKKRSAYGDIEGFLRTPLKYLFILLFLAAFMFWYDRKAGAVVAIAVVLYAVIIMIYYYVSKRHIMARMLAFAIDQSQMQKELLENLALPYVILDTDGNIMWYNSEFQQMLGEKKINRNISYYFPTITRELFPTTEKKNEEFVCSRQDRQYRVQFKLANADIDSSEEEETLSDFDNAYHNSVIAAYFFDETEVRELARENADQKPVVSLIYIDNYDEVTESTEAVRQPLLMALTERKINKSVSEIGGIVTKIEKDKFQIVFHHKYLAQLKSEKFEILDEVRNIDVGNHLPVTLSISIGVDGDTLEECSNYARVAMDMALGRGGDQVVIFNGEKPVYYGGQNRQMEKSTRVKARVKAHALQGIMESRQKVVIMGHSLPDVDALGSAMGIYKLAELYHKEAHIVINEATISIRPVLDAIKASGQFPEDMFIDNRTARDLVDDDTLLMVVDVNRPNYTECPELLNQTRTIVVFDHHRTTSEVISNAVLSYVEPYASSACEMVAEVLQYTNDNVEFKSIEADAMYAGMLIDTDNFVQKTGARTFEAAAYLRRKGADVVRVRKMFRESMDNFKIKARAVSDATIYREKYAFAIFPDVKVDSPTVLASQVADQLLDISGIGASFVLTRVDKKLYISARSIDTVNVQLVMERFDGGGHANSAGAQMTGTEPEEAIQKIEKVLDEMDGLIPSESDENVEEALKRSNLVEIRKGEFK